MKGESEASFAVREQRMLVKAKTENCSLLSLIYSLCSVILPFGARTANAGRGETEKGKLCSFSFVLYLRNDSRISSLASPILLPLGRILHSTF